MLGARRLLIHEARATRGTGRRIHFCATSLFAGGMDSWEDPRVSWRANGRSYLSLSILRIPSVFFAFASTDDETVHLACGGHADDESAREICAARILPNSLSLQVFLAPFLFRLPSFLFEEISRRGFLRIRLKRVVDIIIGYIEEFFEGFYADVTRSNRDDSKFKHVSSTCVQRYFRKCHVVCQLTSLYSVMQTLPSVFAFNLKMLWKILENYLLSELLLFLFDFYLLSSL